MPGPGAERRGAVPGRVRPLGRGSSRFTAAARPTAPTVML